DRDFVHAVYGNFPYVLAFVLILTLVLLARAFRSIVLPIKAAILNLVSLGAAFGIVVFIFKEGHGSSLWNITATQAITAWIPLMIFAFLFGLSMDYEVFMLTRMREAYDETRSTEGAIALGLAAGIIFDATVIRALLVPALMRLLGNANWWLPHWNAAGALHRRGARARPEACLRKLRAPALLPAPAPARRGVARCAPPAR